MNADRGRPAPLRALLFDLGDTLESGGAIVPGAPEALEVIAALPGPTGAPMPLGLVSDYTAAASPEAVGPLFAEYVDIVRGLGLLRWFSPPEQHVTLSTQAGVRKPDPRIFRMALERLGLEPDLGTAAFVTEDAGHIAACRALGMRALQYGPGGDFDDWRAAPLLVVHLLGSDDPAVLLPALDLRLQARFGLSLARIDGVDRGDGDGARVVRGVYHAAAEVPVEVTLNVRGDVAGLRVSGSAVDTRADAARFLATLVDNHAVAPPGEPLAPGVTHTVETGPGGEQVPTRRRFSIL